MMSFLVEKYSKEHGQCSVNNDESNRCNKAYKYLRFSLEESEYGH